MIVKALELVSIVLAALVGGMFWGPWLGLTRTMKSLELPVLIAVVRRMSPNMAAVMTLLLPASLVADLGLTVLAFAGGQPVIGGLAITAFAALLAALVVTIRIEVPIVKQIEGWSAKAPPIDWQTLRDRWGRFHVLRVAAAVVSLTCLAAGAVFF